MLAKRDIVYKVQTRAVNKEKKLHYDIHSWSSKDHNLLRMMTQEVCVYLCELDITLAKQYTTKQLDHVLYKLVL